eukprot:4610392-Alexandrium_andersonii.AAC.1
MSLLHVAPSGALPLVHDRWMTGSMGWSCHAESENPRGWAMNVENGCEVSSKMVIHRATLSDASEAWQAKVSLGALDGAQ